MNNKITFKLEGWFTERSGGEQITPETIFTATSDQTWYAHWSGSNEEYPGISVIHKPVDETVVSEHNDFSETIDDRKDHGADNIRHKTADVNGDSTIDLKDVTLLRRYIAGGWNVELYTEYADVNDDGQVNLRDVILLQRFLAGGWDVTFA